MSKKFGSLVANVGQTFKQEIISPHSGEVLKDKDKNVAFIEMYSADSKAGRQFDKERRDALQRQLRVGDLEPADQLELNIAKCAALTKSWHLVDPVTLEALNVPCTQENAQELYSEPGAAWLFQQAWLGANTTGNFMQRPSKGSSNTDNQSGETAEG